MAQGRMYSVHDCQQLTQSDKVFNFSRGPKISQFYQSSVVYQNICALWNGM